MNELYASLLQLQELDQEIAKAEARVAAFKPKLEELRGPLTGLEKEVTQTRSKLDELRAQQKKLELGAENKREKLRLFQERVEKSKSIRDEAATRTEMDLIRRAIESELEDAKDTTDQVRRSDMKLDDLHKALSKASEDINPRVTEMEGERSAAEGELAQLQRNRNSIAEQIDKASLRLYERVRTGKRRQALAQLTADGACSSCYNVLPMQEQVEIRNATTLRRCEACGVILYTTDA